MDTLKNSGSPWIRPRLLSSKLLRAFVVIDRMKVRTKFEIRSFARLWGLGVLKNFGQSLDTPTLPFLQNFNLAFVRMDPVNVYRPNRKSVALPVREIIGGSGT